MLGMRAYAYVFPLFISYGVSSSSRNVFSSDVQRDRRYLASHVDTYGAPSSDSGGDWADCDARRRGWRCRRALRRLHRRQIGELQGESRSAAVKVALFAGYIVDKVGIFKVKYSDVDIWGGICHSLEGPSLHTPGERGFAEFLQLRMWAIVFCLTMS